MRESASILSLSDFFIGPDSLLMHLANALSIPSTIIFGGSRPVNALGYSQNKILQLLQRVVLAGFMMKNAPVHTIFSA